MSLHQSLKVDWKSYLINSLRGIYMKKFFIFIATLFTILLAIGAVLYRLRGKGIIDKYFYGFFSRFMNIFSKFTGFHQIEETE